MRSLSSLLNKKLKHRPDLTHLISFNGQTVTAFDHSDLSIVELTRRYYENDRGYVCTVMRRDGVIIYGENPAI